MRHAGTSFLACLALLLPAACGGDAPTLDEEYGMNGPLEPTPPPGKEDSEHRRGLPVSVDTAPTRVWTVKNQWEDTDTAAARLPGPAWPADSGLTWDDKYQAWIASLERTPGVAGYYDTFLLTTPWGKTLPSPALECAELSLFLRITFAAWYQLPLSFEAMDQHGNRVFFGHFGVRTASGRYANTPSYATRYKDYSNQSAAEYSARWPSDPALREKRLWGGTDHQSMLGEGQTFGAFVDEIHLNKRAGHFTMLAINYLGSVNLADAANTYNIVPEAVRAGDTLLHRWQRRGIGHTLVVKDVVPVGEGRLDATLLSGSMPRRQGKWESGAASKSYFTSVHAGGPGENSDGDRYAALGGGLKRYRVAKKQQGYWSNTWMRADEAHWINSTDYDRLAERPARFERLLGQVSPEQARAELLAQIEDARRHLANYPASCAARERRENAFRELYDLSAREWGQTALDIDREHRVLADYVFAELSYAESRTCCWNSTTSAMHRIIMDYAEGELAAAEAAGECVSPTVFMSHEDGYERWRAFAEASGRGGQWVAWSEDEACAQRNVPRDTEAPHDHTDYCSLDAPAGGEGGCADAYEPNASPEDAPALSTGSITATVCEGDDDWFRIPAGGTVRITFSHAAGDLDLSAHDSAGTRVDLSQGVTDSETVAVPAGGSVRVYGYAGATGPYTLTVE